MKTTAWEPRPIATMLAWQGGTHTPERFVPDGTLWERVPDGYMVLPLGDVPSVDRWECANRALERLVAEETGAT